MLINAVKDVTGAVGSCCSKCSHHYCSTLRCGQEWCSKSWFSKPRGSGDADKCRKRCDKCSRRPDAGNKICKRKKHAASSHASAQGYSKGSRGRMAAVRP